MDTSHDQLSFEEADKELAFCNSYDRLPTLLDMRDYLSRTNFIRLLGEWWSSCDNISEYSEELEDLEVFLDMGYYGTLKEMMTSEELAAWESLPEFVTIYRGCYEINKWGWSWSLSKDVAKSFPSYLRYCRPGDRPLLVTAKVAKKRIIAVKLDRGEQEIITWRPKHLSTHRMKTPGNNAPVFEEPALA